jgi:hypothetical protein
MKVMMRLEGGKLVPPVDLKFASDVTEVDVDIPSSVLAIPKSKARVELDEILGQYACQRSAVTPVSDKNAWRNRL